VVPSRRQGVVRAAEVGEMGFQMQWEPLVSTALVFLSWGWLQWRSRAYNALGDELESELETLQKLTVETLTSGDAAAVGRVDAAQQAVDATRLRLEEARTLRVGGLEARIRIPERGVAQSFEKGAASQEAKDRAAVKRSEKSENEEGLESRKETLKILALVSVAVLMVPVLFLTVADPMAPPSPELSAQLAEAAELM